MQFHSRRSHPSIIGAGGGEISLIGQQASCFGTRSVLQGLWTLTGDRLNYPFDDRGRWQVRGGGGNTDEGGMPECPTGSSRRTDERDFWIHEGTSRMHFSTVK